MSKVFTCGLQQSCLGNNYGHPVRIPLDTLICAYKLIMSLRGDNNCFVALVDNLKDQKTYLCESQWAGAATGF